MTFPFVRLIVHVRGKQKKEFQNCATCKFVLHHANGLLRPVSFYTSLRKQQFTKNNFHSLIHECRMLYI